MRRVILGKPGTIRRDPETCETEGETVIYRKVQSSPKSEPCVEAQQLEESPNETLVDWGSEEVDSESVKNHCQVTMLVPNTEGQAPTKFGAAFNSGQIWHAFLKQWLLGWVLTSTECK